MNRSATRNLDEAVSALLHFSGVRRPGHDSVESLAALLDALGHPERSYRIVHVAGTSGKTSTSYLVRGLLQAAGFTTGLTVSPHIVGVNERVQVAGLPLAEDRFCVYLDEFLDIARRVGRPFTYFELTIGLALWVFAREEVDYAVVEVGIGGLRDATNAVVAPDKLCVISAVGFDHTDLLGGTLAEIATHKAGIIGPGNTAVVVRQDETVLDQVRLRAAQMHGHVVIADYPDGAPYRHRNAALAQAAVEVLAERDRFQPPPTIVVADPPARYERFDLDGHRLVVDGAHNPQKLAGLVDSLERDGVRRAAVLATLLEAPASKLADSLRMLVPLVSWLVVPEYELGGRGKTKRSFAARVVVEAAQAVGIDAVAVPDLAQAWRALLDRPERDLLVTGSLYLAALVRPMAVASAASRSTLP